MSIRTFWKLLLKILGIWLILDSISVIPQFFSSFIYISETLNNNTMGVITILFLVLITLGIYLLVIRFFIFKSDWIIDKLKLDSGFHEETIDLSIKLRTVLTIATIVIGGLTFVESFPWLCKEIVIFLQQKFVFRESSTSNWMIFYFIKTLIGYLLMTNSSFIINFIDRQKKETE